MNHAVVNSKAIKARPSLEANTELRELVAAMPIVILANAVRAAFGRADRVRAALQTSRR